MRVFNLNTGLRSVHINLLYQIYGRKHARNRVAREYRLHTMYCPTKWRQQH